MDTVTTWKHQTMSQSNKSAQMKDDAGNAALIPGSSAWGALKGGTSQKPLILSSDGSTASSEKTSPKPSSTDKSWPPSCSVLHMNGIVNRWSVSSASGANGAWADNKDVGSGWGSPNSSPIPNAGTEVWSSQKQSVEGASSCWGSDANAGSVWGDAKNNAESDPKNVWSQTASQPSVWSTTGDKSAMSSNWGGRDSGSKWGSVSLQSTAVIAQSSTLNTWAQAAGRGLTSAVVSKSGNSAPGSNMSREELIVRAINSQDGWGQTPIRQDTAWDLTTEPAITSAVCKMPLPQTEPSSQQSSNTGTAIWEASKDTPMVLSSELAPRVLLASLGKESAVVGNFPWVGSETGVAAGWEVPLQVEGSALLSGERGLPVVKSATNSGTWGTLQDNKDGSIAAVSTWNVIPEEPQPGSVAVDSAASQCSMLAALLDKYKQQSSTSSAAAAAWENSGVQSAAATVSSSPTWVGSALPLRGGPLVGANQPVDIWSQLAVSKSANWGSVEPPASAIWSSTTAVCLTVLLV